MEARQESGQARLADGLGWFSIGLGLAEVTAPGTVAKLIGVPEDSTSRSVLRAYGAREIASGIGILSSSQHPAWLWARVAGDALDLATLAAVMRRDGVDGGKILSAIASVAGVMVADVEAARRLGRTPDRRRARAGRADRVSKTFTVNRPAEEVAERWLELRMLPEVDDVRFDAAPGGRGTEIRVQFAPGLFQKFRKGQVQEQLRQFKQLVETGEIARSDGSTSRLQAALPLSDTGAAYSSAGGAR